MKSIVLIGLIENHHSLYEYILNQLFNCFDKICFITKSDIQSEISIKKDHLEIIIDNSRIDKVFKNHLDLINSHEVLITDEYIGLFIRMYTVKLINKKKILIVHNANKWSSIFKPALNYSINFADQFFRKHLSRQFDAYITVSPYIQKYLLSKRIKKPVYFIPFNFSKEIKETINNSEQIKILIPGIISANRRNYKELLAEIERFFSKTPISKITFVFLGKIDIRDDGNIAECIDRLNTLYPEKIRYWKSFIGSSMFEEELNNADYILSNVHPKIIKQGFIEVYGVSKESGVSYLIYKHAKPGIVPSNQIILKDMDSQLVKFNSYSELSIIFGMLENNTIDLKELKIAAKKNREMFNVLIDKESKRFIRFITQA